VAAVVPGCAVLALVVAAELLLPVASVTATVEVVDQRCRRVAGVVVMTMAFWVVQAEEAVAVTSCLGQVVEEPWSVMLKVAVLLVSRY